MRRQRFLILFLLLPTLIPAQDLLIRAGRVITISGDELAPGEVLVRDGRIAAVGRKLDVDATVPALNAPDRVLMPGFCVAHTSDGLQRANETAQVVPFVTVKDGLDPSSLYWENSLRDGHLNVLAIPGDATVIGGVGMVVHPYGRTVEAMIEEAAAGLKISLLPHRRNTRAVQLAKVRGALDDARRHLQSKRRGASKSTGNLAVDIEAMAVDRRKRNLVLALEGQLPCYVSCGTAQDVVQACRLADDYRLKVRLVCKAGTWRAAEFLAARAKKGVAPVILEPVYEVEETDKATGEKIRRVIPKIFHDAGLPFAMTHRLSTLGGRYLWFQAATLVRYGLSRETALKAVTLHAAQAMGVGERKGSIEVGKDADLVLLTDDPLGGQAWVDRAFIGGKVVYNRLRDPRLAEVFGTEGGR